MRKIKDTTSISFFEKLATASQNVRVFFYFCHTAAYTEKKRDISTKNCPWVFNWGIATDLKSTILRAVWCSSCISPVSGARHLPLS